MLSALQESNSRTILETGFGQLLDLKSRANAIDWNSALTSSKVYLSKTPCESSFNKCLKENPKSLSKENIRQIYPRLSGGHRWLLWSVTSSR